MSCLDSLSRLEFYVVLNGRLKTYVDIFEVLEYLLSHSCRCSSSTHQTSLVVPKRVWSSVKAQQASVLGVKVYHYVEGIIFQKLFCCAMVKFSFLGNRSNILTPNQ